MQRMRKLLETSATGAVISSSRLIFGFSKSKYTAMALGVSGVGLIAQSNQLFLLGVTLASLAMASGITNRLSSLSGGEKEDDKNISDGLLSTAFTVQLGVGLFILGLGLLFQKQLSLSVFGLAGTTFPFILTLASIPMATLANSYIQSLFIGRQRYDLFMQASVLSGLFSVIAFFALVHQYGLYGAFLGLLANTVITFLFFCGYIRKIMPLHKIFRFGFVLEEFKILFRYGTVSLVSNACLFGGNLLVRRQVMVHLGVDANGFLQVPLALTAYYTPFLTDGLWNRFFPQISKTGEGFESAEELKVSVQFITIAQTAIAIIMLCFSGVLIKLAYSSAFIESNRLIPAFLVGDYFYFLIFVFTTYFLGIAKLRDYMGVWLGYQTLQVLISVLALPRVGIWAIPLGYGVSSFLFSIVCGIRVSWKSNWIGLRGLLPNIVICGTVVIGQAAMQYTSLRSEFKFILPILFMGYCLWTIFSYFKNSVTATRNTSPERILFVIDTLGRGGAEQALLNLLPNLLERGYRCDVAVLTKPYDLSKEIEDLGVRVHRLDLFHRWSLLEGAYKLNKLTNNNRYQILHAHLFFSAVHVAFGKFFRKDMTRVVSFHSLEFNRDPATTLWKSIRRSIQLRLLKTGFDGWTAVSQSVADHYESYIFKKVNIIPNALGPAFNLTHAKVPLSTRAAVFGKYGKVEESAFIIVMPGRLIVEKGHHYLIQALGQLREKGIFPQVFCFGIGPLQEAIQSEIAEHGLSQQVHLCGLLPQAELIECIRHADMVTQPSESEGFGLAVAEAMALGKPLVASSCGGLSELIEDGISGLLAPPKDAEALAGAIAKLFQNVELRKSMGSAARERIMTVLNGKTIAKQMEGFYASIY